MGTYVAGRMVKAMLKHQIELHGARVLILGLAFKENCPDLRNTRVIDIVSELRDYGVQVEVHDPCVDPDEAQAVYGISITSPPRQGEYDGIILAVPHDEYQQQGAASLRAFGKPKHLLFDLKSVFDVTASDLRL